MAKIASDVDYDIIGLSYYSWEKNHKTISELKANIAALKKTYNKAVVVAESSSHCKANDGVLDEDRVNAALHMVNPETGKIYSDLQTETVNGKVQLKGSISNQKNVFAHIIQESYDAGAEGIFAWGGEYRGNWKYGFFDWNGNAFESLDVFKEN